MLLFSDSWHHIENQTTHISLLQKMLKPGCKIVTMTFTKKNRATDANETLSAKASRMNPFG
jgi:hypothetical protein